MSLSKKKKTENRNNIYYKNILKKHAIYIRMRVFTYFSFFLYVNNVATLNGFRLESKITTIMGEYGANKPINNIVKTPFYNKKENEGCDTTRPSENEEENTIILNKIRVNLKKQKLLLQLENKSVSNLDKLEMIEENKKLFSEKNKLMIDLSSGGLYNDFDFE